MKKLSIARVALLLAIPTIIFTLALRGENSFRGFERGDMLSHQAYVKMLVDAFSERSLGLDRWDTGCCFGSPVFRSYQNLPHYIAAAITYVTKASIGRVMHFLVAFILAVQPLIFYLAARKMGLSQLTGIAAAWLSPLIFSKIPFGVEFRSYVVFGTGLFPQMFAVPALLFALGSILKATAFTPSTNSPLRNGLELGVWLALTFLFQHFYGYMALVCLALLGSIALAMRWVTFRHLLTTTLWAAALTVIGSGYQLLSILQDAPLMHQTNWYHRSRWDGMGLAPLMQSLISGDTLDLWRFPFITLLAGLGLLLSYRNRQAKAFVAVLAAAIFFCAGRTTFGKVFDYLPGTSNLHLERFIGLIHIACLFLAAHAVGTFLEQVVVLQKSSRLLQRCSIVGLVLLIVGFAAAGKERLAFLAENDLVIAKQKYFDRMLDPKLFPSVEKPLSQGHFWSLRALDQEVPSLGRVPYFNVARQLGHPQLSIAEQSMTYTSDSVYFFSAGNRQHYRLFNVQAVLLPKSAQNVPDFLRAVYQNADYVMYATPALGYWDVVGFERNVIVPDSSNYSEEIKAWITDPNFSTEDYPSFVPQKIAKKFPSAIPQVASQRHPEGWGTVLKGEKMIGRSASATLQANFEGAHGLFRMAYHPRWKVSVNGKPVEPRWAGAGFLAVPLELGTNQVYLEFPEDRVRAFLFLFGLLTVGLTFIALLVVAPEKSRAAQLRPAPGSVFA